jgi:hypothetical protein
MRTEDHHNLEEYRIRAGKLLKDLRGTDPTRALQAARRFRILPSWTGRTPDRVQRKHALAVIAREAGFRDWPHLRTSVGASPAAGFETTRLFQPRTGGFLNLLV